MAGPFRLNSITRIAIDPLRLAPPLPQQDGRLAARARIRDQALRLIADEDLVAAAVTFRIVPLDGIEGPVLLAGGERLHAPRLLPESGRLTALGCGAATIGPALERRVSALFAERRISLAVALDELGNQMLLEASRRLYDRLRAAVAKAGLTMAGELRPGDPGLEIDHQARLLRLADAAAIGVSCSPGGALQPLKSTSMLFGVGEDLPEARWSRCDDCPSLARCKISGAKG